MSSEHLWPKWAREAIASTQKGRRIRNSLHDGPGPAYKSWYQPAFEATLKSVCPECNNGWMSKIETAAKPLALPLMLGHSLALGPAAQQKLALWAYLKCSLFQTFEKDDRIKAAMAKAYPVFYELQKAERLAPHCSVFIARHIGLRVGQYQHRLLALSPDRPVAFVQTLTVGELVLQVVRSYLGSSPPWDRRDPRVDGCDRRIWPVSGAFTWPPGDALSDVDLDVYTGPHPEHIRTSRIVQPT